MTAGTIIFMGFAITILLGCFVGYAISVCDDCITK